MHSHILAAVLSIPNPQKGSPPPGYSELETLLGWVAWIGLAAGVAGVITVGAMMALQHQRGRASEHMTGLAWVLVGCILVVSASALIKGIT